MPDISYVCFLDIAPVPLTRFWVPRLELRSWNNVVCALEGSGLEAVLHSPCFKQARGVG